MPFGSNRAPTLTNQRRAARAVLVGGALLLAAFVLLSSDAPTRFRDWNAHSLMDILVHFAVNQSGLGVGDTKACVTGELLDGTPFTGCDAVEVFAPRGSGP